MLEVFGTLWRREASPSTTMALRFLDLDVLLPMWLP